MTGIRRAHVLIAVAAALGLATALSVTTKPALAWDVHNLPPAFHVEHTVTTRSTCPSYYTIVYAPDGTGYGKTGAVSPDLCDDSPTFQQDLDAFVSSPCTYPGATCTPPPPPATTATDASTTTAAATTTEGSPPPAPTTTQTVTVTTTVVDPTIAERLAALEAKYAELAARVDAIEKANTAAWDAFIAVLEAGGTADQAALAARSAGLDAIYELS
jgi:hypothetical protein